VFSETQRAAGLLQQFGGFPFSAAHVSSPSFELILTSCG
jgi:hypothetical protein